MTQVPKTKRRRKASWIMRAYFLVNPTTDTSYISSTVNLFLLLPRTDILYSPSPTRIHTRVILSMWIFEAVNHFMPKNLISTFPSHVTSIHVTSSNIYPSKSVIWAILETAKFKFTKKLDKGNKIGSEKNPVNQCHDARRSERYS